MAFNANTLYGQFVDQSPVYGGKAPPRDNPADKYKASFLDDIMDARRHINLCRGRIAELTRDKNHALLQSSVVAQYNAEIAKLQGIIQYYEDLNSRRILRINEALMEYNLNITEVNVVSNAVTTREGALAEFTNAITNIETGLTKFEGDLRNPVTGTIVSPDNVPAAFDLITATRALIVQLRQLIQDARQTYSGDNVVLQATYEAQVKEGRQYLDSARKKLEEVHAQVFNKQAPVANQTEALTSMRTRLNPALNSRFGF